MFKTKIFFLEIIFNIFTFFQKKMMMNYQIFRNFKNLKNNSPNKIKSNNNPHQEKIVILKNKIII